jgi:hypothetical protein
MLPRGVAGQVWANEERNSIRRSSLDYQVIRGNMSIAF